MKTQEPYVRVLSKAFFGETHMFPEGTLGVVVSFVSRTKVKFLIVFEEGRTATEIVPINFLYTPPKKVKVMFLAELFRLDPVLAIRSTINQQIIRSLVVKLVEDHIVVSEKARCFALLEAAVQKKSINSGVAVHFMDMLRAQLSGTIRQTTVFSLN